MKAIKNTNLVSTIPANEINAMWLAKPQTALKTKYNDAQSAREGINLANKYYKTHIVV